MGQRGHIIYSDDRGINWHQASVPVSSNLTAVSFPTSRIGWAVGHDGVVLKSTNAGVNWIKQLDGNFAGQIMASHYKRHPPKCLSAAPERMAALLREIELCAEQGIDMSFLDVYFQSDTTGYIVGAFNLIFRTNDGGNSWIPWFERTENDDFFHLYGIHDSGKDLFLCGEQGLILKLNPSTGYFQKLTTPYNGTFFGMNGRSGELIAYGLRGNAFRSDNNGSNWHKIETGILESIIDSVVMEDGLIILASQAGTLLVSSDGGMSYKRRSWSRFPFPATAIVQLDKETLMLAGLHGIHKLSSKALSVREGSGRHLKGNQCDGKAFL